MSYGKCYNCSLIGLDVDAKTVVQDGDRKIPVCEECAKTYLFFNEEYGHQERLSENDDVGAYGE